jgi:DMSO/TMAO reductase YedYZ molybdopterin-dependent catalytic subunit
LTIRKAGGDECLVPVSELVGSEAALDRTVDLHCVTTWSVRDQTWTGVPVRAWSDSTIGPAGHQAVFVTDDLFADDVLLAWGLNGEPLDHRHGAPLRLVSPAQYGYKNVKHVQRIELCAERPVGTLGAKEHLRARVAEEERHSRWPAWLVRLPYRILVPVTAIAAEHSARQR